MKKVLLTVVLVASIAVQSYAAGDLIVDGNLAVGTTSPLGKLAVTHGGTDPAGLTSVTEARDLFVLSNQVSGIVGIRALHDGGNAYDGGMAFLSSAFNGSQYAWTERLRLTSTGNIGIGTPNPSALLHVYSSGTANGYTAIIGENPASPTAGEAGIAFVRYTNGSVYSDFKTVSGGNIYFRSGAGAQGGGSRTWMTVDPSNGNIGIGSSPSTTLKLDVQGQVASNGIVLTSDARFKTNLLPIDTALDKILNLTGLTYEWKTDQYKEKNFPEGRHYGVIAQEIEKVLPEVVKTAPDGTKAVAYNEIIPVLIEAIKEQQKQIDLLKKQVGL